MTDRADAPAPAAAAADAGIGRATALITLARSAQMFTFLATSIYLARRLESSVYGTYQHVPFLATAIPMAVSVPLAKAVTYFTPRHRRPDAFLRATALVLAGVGIAAAFAIALVPAVLRAFDPKDAQLLDLRALVGAVVGFSFAQAISEYVLIARGRRMGVVWLLVAQSAWNLFGIGGAALFAPEATRLEWTLLAFLGSTALPAIVTFRWLLAKSDDSAGESDGPTRAAVVAYTAPLVLAVGVNYAAAQIDKLLVPWLFPKDLFPSAKDHYFRAAMELPIVGALATTLLSLVAPTLSKLHGAGDRAGLLDVWRRTCRRIAVLTMPLAGLMCAVAAEAFTLVYGERYTPAVPIFRWYLVRIVIMVFVPQVLLECVGATGRSLVFSAVAISAAGAFTAVLALHFDLAGIAAAAVLASLVTNWVFGGWVATRYLSARWSDLCDWGHLLRLLAVCGAATTVSILVIPSGWGVAAAAASVGTAAPWARTGVLVCGKLTEGLAHGAVYAAAFVPLALALRCLRREDIEMLRGIVTRRRQAA